MSSRAEQQNNEMEKGEPSSVLKRGASRRLRLWRQTRAAGTRSRGSCAAARECTHHTPSRTGCGSRGSATRCRPGAPPLLLLAPPRAPCRWRRSARGAGSSRGSRACPPQMPARNLPAYPRTPAPAEEAAAARMSGSGCAAQANHSFFTQSCHWGWQPSLHALLTVAAATSCCGTSAKGLIGKR